jgi:hypothetical protein
MKEHDTIITTVLNYVEGWYEGDADRMNQVLSPHLAKRRIVSEEEIWTVTKDWMVEATGDGRGRLDNPKEGRKEITILDQNETMASVKLMANEFSDYIHLAKVGGTWMIVNVLWDYHPK